MTIKDVVEQAIALGRGAAETCRLGRSPRLRRNNGDECGLLKWGRRTGAALVRTHLTRRCRFFVFVLQTVAQLALDRLRWSWKNFVAGIINKWNGID
jgi:hypothetical protein